MKLEDESPLDGAPDALAADHSLCLFVPRSGYSGWL
jgi:hypothetical protein